MLARMLTAFLVLLLAATTVAWLVALLHEKGVRPVRGIVGFVQKLPVAGRCVFGVLFVVFGMRAGEKFGGGLRSSNLPVEDEWENMPPISSTNTTRALTGDDFRRGFVLVGLSTNSPFSIFNSPFSNAVVCADWRDFGAAEDWEYVNAEWRIENGELWGGVLSNETTRLRIHSDGWAEVLGGPRPVAAGDGADATGRVPPAEALRAAHDALRAKLLPQVYSLGFLNPDVEYFA